MSTSACCKSGQWPQVPRREPSTLCSDQTRGTWWLYVDPRAAILLGQYGLNPCDIPHGPDDVLRWQDAEAYLKQHQYIS